MIKKLLTLLVFVFILCSCNIGMCEFKDVDKNNPYYEMLKDMEEEGFIKGFPDGEFKGNQDITRLQEAIMLYRTKNFLSEMFLKKNADIETKVDKAISETESLSKKIEKLQNKLDEYLTKEIPGETSFGVSKTDKGEERKTSSVKPTKESFAKKDFSKDSLVFGLEIGYTMFDNSNFDNTHELGFLIDYPIRKFQLEYSFMTYKLRENATQKVKNRIHDISLVYKLKNRFNIGIGPSFVNSKIEDADIKANTHDLNYHFFIGYNLRENIQLEFYYLNSEFDYVKDTGRTNIENGGKLIKIKYLFW